MYKDKKLVYAGLTISLVLLFLYYTSQQSFKSPGFDSNSFFCIMLLGLLMLIYIERKKRMQIAIGTILGLLSYLIWFSVAPLTEYNSNIIPAEPRIAAVILWCFALLVLIPKSTKAGKRKQFPQLVKREVIHKQKNRCATCKRKLGPYEHDFHHANGDRSDNRYSNCRALCIPCHRRKHAK